MRATIEIGIKLTILFSLAIGAGTAIGWYGGQTAPIEITTKAVTPAVKTHSTKVNKKQRSDNEKTSNRIYNLAMLEYASQTENNMNTIPPRWQTLTPAAQDQLLANPKFKTILANVKETAGTK